MKARLAVLVSTLVLAAVPVFAQPTAAAGPALDPAAVQAARQMMDAMHIRELMVQSLQQAEQRMPAQMRPQLTAIIENNRNMDAQQKQQALAQLEKNLAKMQAQNHMLFSDASLVDDILAEMVPLYAQTYTVDEIRQLSAFYASPLGQKMLANMPRVMAQSMEISNRVIMPRVQKIMEQTAQAVVGN